MRLCRRGGTQIEDWRKIALLTPKSCREGPGSLIILKYVFERGSLRVNICDSAIIGAAGASGSWKSASKPLKMVDFG